MQTDQLAFGYFPHGCAVSSASLVPRDLDPGISHCVPKVSAALECSPSVALVFSKILWTLILSV